MPPTKHRWRHVRRSLPGASIADSNDAAHRIIAELKRTEEALRRTQAELAVARRELQLTIDTIPALVVTFAPDGKPNFVNRTWQDFTGFTLEQARGQEDFIHPGDTERAGRAWQAALASGGPFSIECRLRRADGTYRWHSIRRKPLHNDKGEITKWYGAAFDIEDRRIAENALERSEAYLAEAQTLSHTDSFGWNASTGEILWSGETYRIFG
jgi:PAS domain S-box-containing protein